MALHPINTLSVCSGVGGLDIGLSAALRRAGFAPRTVCYVEREAYAASVLVSRMEEGRLDLAPVWSDLSTFDPEPWRGLVDCVFGGIPCFVAGTLVLTARGHEPIEHVRVGDLVLTHRGRWRRVTAVMGKSDAAVRRVRGGPVDVTCTDEHPFYARQIGRRWDNERRRYERKWSEPAWVEAAAARGTFVGEVLPPVREDERSADFWWVVGRYLADGWRACAPSARGKGRVVICCARHEAGDLEQRLRHAGFNPCRSECRTTTKFYITRKWFHHFLEPFGHRAEGKRLPRAALSLPADLAGALLDGYLSGDGHRTGNNWRVSSVSERLARGIALLALRARGVVASLRRYEPARQKHIEGRLCNQRPRWVVDIPASNRSAIVDGDYGWALCRSSERLPGRHVVYNLAVAEDESYCAGGAIVHNCQPFSVAGKQRAHEDERHLWPYVADIVRVLEPKPRLICIENVAGHLATGTPDVVRELQGMGYRTAATLWRAEEVGAPHRRERVFIVGARA